MTERKLKARDIFQLIKSSSITKRHLSPSLLSVRKKGGLILESQNRGTKPYMTTTTTTMVVGVDIV